MPFKAAYQLATFKIKTEAAINTISMQTSERQDCSILIIYLTLTLLTNPAKHLLFIFVL